MTVIDDATTIPEETLEITPDAEVWKQWAPLWAGWEDNAPAPEPPTSVFGDANWTTYRVQLTFTGIIVGGNPSDPGYAEAWIRRALGEKRPDELQRLMRDHLLGVLGLNPATATEEQIIRAITEQALDKSATVFKRTPWGVPYIEGRQIKAMLKENTNIAWPGGKYKWGQHTSRGGASKGTKVGGKDPYKFVSERVWVPEKPYLLPYEVHMSPPVVGHPEDPRTKQTRATISMFEYIVRPVLDVELQVQYDEITHEQWSGIWQSAERNGLGARRSQNEGQFKTTLWEKV